MEILFVSTVFSPTAYDNLPLGLCTDSLAARSPDTLQTKHHIIAINLPMSVAMLPPLPEDVYITVFQYLSLQDIMAIRKVCRSFRDMTYLRGLWGVLLRREIQNRCIPIPRLGYRHLEQLTANQLERCVYRSLVLHRNWTASSPGATKQRHIQSTGDAEARIISIHFVTVEQRCCLLVLSLSHHAEPRMVTLECWDIMSETPFCIARRRAQWSGGYAVNTDSKHSGIIAITTFHVEVLGIDTNARDPDSAFITLITLSQAKSVLSFTGNTMIFRALTDEAKIIDITRPLSEAILHYPQPPHLQNQPESFEAVIQEEYAVVLRPTTLELYALAQFRNGKERSIHLTPVTVYHFQWRIDTCRMQCRIATPASAHGPLPINILIRYTSTFPWPVNLLHHYVLYPNPLYTPSTPDSPTIVSPSNVPYDIIPVLSQTIASPVRLFAMTDMALGPYGTAVWLDSHTEEYFNQGEIGQRLAGRALLPLDSDDEGVDPADNDTHTAASMVFKVHETDDWNRVAVDEREGRIAVGSVTGRVVLYDYA